MSGTISLGIEMDFVVSALRLGRGCRSKSSVREPRPGSWRGRGRGRGGRAMDMHPGGLVVVQVGCRRWCCATFVAGCDGEEFSLEHRARWWTSGTDWTMTKDGVYAGHGDGQGTAKETRRQKEKALGQLIG